MSQATVRDLRSSKTGEGLDDLLGKLPELLSTAASEYVKLLRRGIELAADVAEPVLDRITSANECCGVPTQECPPRCPAEITWEACAGETQRAVINVKNTGAQTRNFAFAATPLGPVQPELSPTSATLAPGQAVAVQVAVPTNEGFKPGETYTGEVTIRGAYEQCVKLVLRIATPQVASVDIKQGEPPQRITELKWYRHWQCTEPCVPATRDPVPAPPRDPAGTGLQARG